MDNFEPRYVKIAVLRADGGTTILSFQTRGRGNSFKRQDGTDIPGMVWINREQGIWARYDNDATIADEVAHAPIDRPVSWQRITDDTLQADREFRNALKAESGKLVHDMPMAREVKRGHIRRERVQAFAKLDGDFTRALGQGKKADQAAVEVERQKWRDAPADPRIEAALTVEELKQIKAA